MKREAERCWGTDKCARLEVGPGALPVRASGWLGSGLGGAGGGGSTDFTSLTARWACWADLWHLLPALVIREESTLRGVISSPQAAAACKS